MSNYVEVFEANSKSYLSHNLIIRDLHFYSNFLIDFLHRKRKHFKIRYSLVPDKIDKKDTEKFFQFLWRKAAEEKNNQQPFLVWLENQAGLFYKTSQYVEI